MSSPTVTPLSSRGLWDLGHVLVHTYAELYWLHVQLPARFSGLDGPVEGAELSPAPARTVSRDPREEFGQVVDAIIQQA